MPDIPSFPRGVPGRNIAKSIAPHALWADPSDICQHQHWKYTPGKVFLGSLQSQLIGVDDDRHMMTIAGSRAGKGVSTIIPNLLEYPGSILVIDPKGENARITKSRRDRGSKVVKQGLGQDVIVLDPFGVSGHPTNSFNPLTMIDTKAETAVDDAALSAEALIIPQQGEGRHWTDAARNFLRGLILYVCVDPRPEPLYHANIDPDRKVKMPAEQWQRSIDALEEKLGLQDHARAVVLHVKHGREHIHVVWNRINLETMRTVHDGHNYRKHELVARTLEREFGHERVQGAHIEREGKPRPERTAPKWAMQQGERLKIDPRQVKAQVQELWKASDSGRSFAAALNDRGFAIAKGDRRDFIIVDHAGGVHSLGRCVGSKASEVRGRMADVDRETLPTVEQAVEAMRARPPAERPAPERSAVREEFAQAAAVVNAPKTDRSRLPTPLPRAPEKPLDETAADIRRAYTISDNARTFAATLAHNGIHLAAVTPNEALRGELEQRAGKKEGRETPLYLAGEIVAVGPTGQVFVLDRHTTGEERKEVEKFLGTLDRKQLQGIEATQEQINLRAEQFIALSQVGALDRTEKPDRTSLPRDDSGEKNQIDWKRYLTDRDYRRDVQGQQQKERPQPERQRGRDGLER
jgi:type IV secretory system conjugative DNA transfer VirD4/TraG family protein/relaxase-like protein